MIQIQLVKKLQNKGKNGTISSNVCVINVKMVFVDKLFSLTSVADLSQLKQQ